MGGYGKEGGDQNICEGGDQDQRRNNVTKYRPGVYPRGISRGLFKETMSPLLTINEVAATLQVDPRTIRRYVKDRKLAGIKLPGGEWRFKEEFLNNWLETRTMKADPI